jgi:hypothetical protein
MKKPNDAAQALIDGMAARAAAHKAKLAEVRAAPKECRFCGHSTLSLVTALKSHRRVVTPNSNIEGSGP